MKNLLTIVIPTWNNLDMLKICIESLFLSTKYPFEVIVIDNGGKSEVAKSLPDSAKEYVKVIEPEENLGWMKAHNLALETVETPYYCLLNDDVIFIPAQWDFWTKLISHLKDNVVAVGPGSNFVAGNQSIQRTDVPLVCDSSFLIGFCMVIRTDIFKEIGGLDAELPGGDDLDLSIRLIKAGYSIRIDRRAYLHHHGQQTGLRVHGDDWDSNWSQEVTNNALISKHGVRAWQECILAHWKYPKEWDLDKPLLTEEDWYKELLKPYNGASGLNIGCGGRKLEGPIGVDIRDAGELGEGGERLGEALTDIKADATSVPLDDESQEYIVAAHILEHLIDPFAALIEWNRLLVPKGKLFLTIPNHGTSNTIILDYTHLHAFNKDSLERLVKVSGFDIDSIESETLNNIRLVCHKVSEVLA